MSHDLSFHFRFEKLLTNASWFIFASEIVCEILNWKLSEISKLKRKIRNPFGH